MVLHHTFFASVRYLLTFAIFICTIIPCQAHAQTSPQVARGIAWLTAQVQADGSLQNESVSIATPLQNRSEAALTLRLLATMPPSLANSVIADNDNNTQYLARKLIASVSNGNDGSAILPLLLQNQNADGGFGGALGYASEPDHTAWAILALAQAGQAGSTVANAARVYLGSLLETDGAMPGATNWERIHNSAQALLALQTNHDGGENTRINGLSSWLLQQQDADGGWMGNSYLSAVVFSALAPLTADTTVRTKSVNFFLQRQNSDGSWNGDPYLTALILRSLSSQYLPPVIGSSAGIKGKIADKASNVPLANATIELSSGGTISKSVTSDANGVFNISNLVGGSYSMNIRRNGYVSVQANLNLQAGQLTDFGIIYLSQQSSSGILRGQVVNNSNNALPGASITVSGAGNATATTDLNGRYEISNLAPGNYTINASLNGYKNASANASLSAGQTLIFSPTLYQNDQTVPAGIRYFGQVLDLNTNAALAGVGIQITGSTNVSASTGADGTFDITLNDGNHDASFSLNGYLGVSQKFGGSTGSLINAGQIKLAKQQTTSNISGKVLDSQNKPIVGASVKIVATNQVAIAGNDGRYQLDKLNGLSFSVEVSATGYSTLKYSLQLTRPADVTQDFVLLASRTPETRVGIIGSFVDSVTDEVLAGVQVDYIDGTGSHTINADAEGRFNIAQPTPDANGGIALSFSLNQYLGSSVYLALSELVTVDLGQIRLRKSGTTTGSPDLTVVKIIRDAAKTDPQTLQLSGSLTAEIKNIGNQKTRLETTVLAFADSNRNNLFDKTDDVILGQATLPANLDVGQSVLITIPLNGKLDFRDAPIHVLVDPIGQIAEASTNNNIRSSALEALFTPVTTDFKPKLKWEWNGGGVLPTSKQVMMAPIVIPTRDTNGDGKINVDDVPSIVFTSYSGYYAYAGYGVIRILDGRTGAEINTLSSTPVATVGGIAAADLDGDGIPEIVATSYPSGLPIALKPDGQVLWQATEGNIPYLPGAGGNWSAPFIADLDGDGVPEVISVNHVYDGRTGKLKWVANSGYFGQSEQGNKGLYSIPVVADLFGTGKQNLILGPSVFDSDGNLIWVNREVGDGHIGIADLDGDGHPELVLVSAGKVAVFDRFGKKLWGPVTIPGTNGLWGGPPTIADFDGDGVPDIGVADTNNYSVFRADGSLMWTHPAKDYGSGMTGSTSFDFYGDGKPKILYSDESSVFVMDGRSGATVTRIGSDSATTFEYPLVVDADGDGHADFVTIRNDYGRHGDAVQGAGVRVFQDENNAWAGVRKIWNQHAYSITNINDDLSIPRKPIPSWKAHNTFRLNKRIDGEALGLPDLTISYARMVDGGDAGSRITLRAGNAGSAKISKDTQVAIYTADPAISAPGPATLLAVVKLGTDLATNEYVDIPFPIIQALNQLRTNTLWAVGDDNGSGKHQLEDFNRNNNTLIIPLTPSLNSLAVAVAVDQPAYPANTNVLITATITNHGSFDATVPIQLIIQTKSGDLLARIPAQLGQVARASDRTVNSLWHTGTVNAGAYQVTAQLLDQNGAAFAEAVAGFDIININGTIKATIQTDKQLYQPSETVQLRDVLTNLAQNVALNDLTVLTMVTNPDNSLRFSGSEALLQLAAGGGKNYGYSVPLNFGAPGQYTAQLNLKAKDGTVLAQSQTRFTVASSADSGIGLSGTLVLAPKQLPLGETLALSLDVLNSGNAALVNLPVRLRIVDPVAGKTVAEYAYQTTLVVGGRYNANASWLGAGTVGTHLVAVLSAQLGGKDLTLAQDSFTLIAPPIKLRISQNLLQGSRVLVLLSCTEDEDENDDDDDEHHDEHDDFSNGHDDDEHDHDDEHHDGDSTRCTARRSQVIAQTLSALKVPYLITSNAASFQRALRSGRYNVYWISGRQDKLHGSLPDEVREAVYAGDGVIFDGTHDQRNKSLDTVAGLVWRGKIGETGLPVEVTGPLLPPMRLASVGRALKVQTNGVSVAQAHFNGRTPNAAGPAIISNRYGNGLAMSWAFDLVSSIGAQSAWRANLGAGLQALQPLQTSTLTPGAVLALKTQLDNLAKAVDVVVKTTLPTRSVVWATLPQADWKVADNSVNWAFNLPENRGKDEGKELLLSFQVPPVAGIFNLQTTVSSVKGTTVTPYGSPLDLSFNVVAASTTNAAVKLNLQGLVLGGKEKKLRDSLITQLQTAMTAFNANTASGYDSAISQLLQMVDQLPGLVSANAADMRSIHLGLDRLIREAQWRWGQVSPAL
jgi:hypothetical protein